MNSAESKNIIDKINSGDYKCMKNDVGKSTVWQHFREIFDTKTNAKLEFVQCDYCKSILKYKSSLGSSRLSRHAKTCAPSKTSNTLQTYFHVPAKQVTKNQKNNILESCVKLCTEDLRPFDIVEGQGFLHLAQNLINVGASLGKVNAADILPHRTTISKHVRQTAENSRREIVPVINNIFQNIGGALTTDLWTEPFRQVSYIGISCHYINDDFELKPVVISTCSFPSIPKNSVNILTEMMDTLQNIGFDVSIFNRCTFVADEGSNIVAALKCYKRLTCVCHLLNTVLKHSYNETSDDFPNLKSSVENCKSLVRYLKKSGAVNELERTVHQEVDSRWNTLCFMLRSVLSQYPEIKDLMERRKESHRLQDIKPELLQTLLTFLEIFEQASTQLEGDLYPTLHRVLLWNEYLKKKCIPKVTDSELEKSLKVTTEKWLAKKIKIDQYHKIATFLHPKFKSLKMLSDDEKLEVHFQVRDMIPKDAVKYSTTSNAESTPTLSTSKQSKDIFEEWADNSIPEELSTDEIKNYIDFSFNGELEDKYLLNWWKNSPFPNLAKVARKILSIPASSTTCERDFSVAGRVLEERRCNLNPESVDSILFLKHLRKNEIKKS